MESCGYSLTLENIARCPIKRETKWRDTQLHKKGDEMSLMNDVMSVDSLYNNVPLFCVDKTDGALFFDCESSKHSLVLSSRRCDGLFQVPSISERASRIMCRPRRLFPLGRRFLWVALVYLLVGIFLGILGLPTRTFVGGSDFFCHGLSIGIRFCFRLGGCVKPLTRATDIPPCGRLGFISLVVRHNRDRIYDFVVRRFGSHLSCIGVQNTKENEKWNGMDEK